MQEEIRTEETKHISIDDFTKVEIMLGTIKSVELVEGSDKLYRLKVDFGESKEIENDDGFMKTESHVRNVLSGIRKLISVEDLTGKQFPFITNLAPRKMMGEYSEAMILAGSEVQGGDKLEVLALMSPTAKLSNGTKLR